MSMSDILSSLNLDADITEALLEQKGELGELLKLAESLEQGDWAYVELFQRKLKQSLTSVSKLYFDTMANVNKYVDWLYKSLV